MKTEIIHNLADADYFAAEGVSKHVLDDFERNPWAFFRRLADGKKDEEPDTPALAFGRALHAAVLTPSRFEDSVSVLPPEIKVRRGKAWDEFSAANVGKTIISSDQADFLAAVRNTLAAFSPAKEIFDASSENNRELAVFWTQDKFPEIQLKSKIDFVSDNGKLIGDLKTCVDASPEGFAKACDAFGYHRQAAFYMDAYAAATGKAPELFAFLAIEKDYPFTPALYTFEEDSDFILAGRIGYLLALKRYADFSAKKPEEIPVGFSEHNLLLPAWNKDLKNLKEAIFLNK